MKELVIISGKGGTGKTTITASFASLAENKIMCDCDVDAANLFLLINPTILEEEEIRFSKVANINEEECNKCGICEENCRFKAISNFKVDPIKCEGCGVCELVCPLDAISLESFTSGKIFTTTTKYGPFFYAKLNPGAGNTGRLATEIRNRAFNLANENGSDLVIIDGSPGIGCPVIASITGTDIALVVTEPTLSGEHDLERIIKLTECFRVKTFVCINKFDINPEITKRIEKYCQSKGLMVAGKIPYNPVVTEAMTKGFPVVEFVDNEVTDEIKKIWGLLLKEVVSPGEL